MLLEVVLVTKADSPAVGRLEGNTPIGVSPNVRTFYRPCQAARHAAVVAAHPRAMSRALAAIRLAGFLALKPVR